MYKASEQQIYNFAGQVVQTRVHQFYSSTNYYILDTFFKYDHRGRLIQTDYQVDGNSGNLVPRTVVSAMVYDEAGQLKTKYLHSQSTKPFLQKVDYRYNIRGWLTGINDPGLTGTESDQFGMTLYYNKSSSGTAGYYNGNIQGEKWGITSYLNQVNTYTYDKLNRITGSKFGTTNSFRTSYSYDCNGNILELTRRGSTGAYIDSISYGYKVYTNQLDYTSDYYGDAPGWDFPGTLIGSNHYQYDANGNMTRDDYKAVNVSYNSFNLPTEIDFGNNQKLNYYYDGSGQKLTKISSPGTYYPTNTEYRGLMVHQSCNGTSSLKYIITPEGRLLNTGTNAAPVWGWEYDLKDHLGNTRVTFKPNATNNGVVRNGYATYFPFGMKMPSPYVSGVMSNYLYNGKENQDDFGLNWYDYGSRMYDPAIGRWHTTDPRAEKYFSYSPYNYCINNPMNFIDPQGDTVKYAGAAEEAAYNDYKNNVNSRVESYDKRTQTLRDKGKTERADKRDANRSDNAYVQVQRELSAAESDENVFMIRMGSNISNSAGAGNVSYNSNTKEIDVNIAPGGGWSTIQKVAHEFKHVDQFIHLELDLNPGGGGGLLYEKTDEVAAFERQNLFGTPVDAKTFVNENYSDRREGPKSFHLLTPVEQTQYKTTKYIYHGKK